MNSYTERLTPRCLAGVAEHQRVANLQAERWVDAELRKQFRRVLAAQWAVAPLRAPEPPRVRWAE